LAFGGFRSRNYARKHKKTSQPTFFQPKNGFLDAAAAIYSREQTYFKNEIGHNPRKNCVSSSLFLLWFLIFWLALRQKRKSQRQINRDFQGFP
jgi:hypothetical protein